MTDNSFVPHCIFEASEKNVNWDQKAVIARIYPVGAFKVIHPKYYKHKQYTLAATIDSNSLIPMCSDSNVVFILSMEI